MFTTNKFSIRTNRGMGELDSPGTYRDRGWRGERADRRRGRVKGGERVAAVEILRANSEQRISGTVTGEK